MERNIQKIGLLNLVVLLLSGGTSYILARYTDVLAGQVGAVFFGIGFFVALVSYFQMRLEEKERLEKLEFDEITREKNAASLFSTEAESFPARRSREQFERFFLPGFTVLLCVVEIGAAYVLWRRLQDVILARPTQAMVSLSLFGVLALVLFLLGKYSANVARFEKQRLLRPGASFLVLGAYICATIAICVGLVSGGVTRADLYLSYALVILLGLAGLESLLNLILELYRPRGRGKVERLVYESRLLGLLAHPEGIFSTAAQALDYQFGFKVSETWVYRFLERALAWLILIQFVVLVVSSCFVFIGPGEEGLLERWGRPARGDNLLRPGLHVKLPWPVDKVYRFRTDEVQSFNIGMEQDDDHGNTIVWAVQHEEAPLNLMVAADDNGSSPVETNQTTEAGGVPADLLTVGIPVQYQIKDVRAFAYNHINSGELLEKIATREVVRYLVGVDLFEIMSSGKAEASADLQKLIQEKADALKLGVKILLVGLEDIHPPQKVAGAFENVNAARQESEAKVRQAEGYAVRTRTLAQGEAVRLVREAEAYQEERVTTAEAQAERFRSQMMAFNAAPEVYRQRAYLANWMNSTNARLYVVTPTNTFDVYQLNLEEKISADMTDIPIPSANQ